MNKVPRPRMLIAHRGGVVDAERSENSFKALNEAFRRGYTHVEIDARMTGDGGVVCFHNDELLEEAGVEGKVSEMRLDALTRVVLTRSGERIPTFEDYCARCAGRVGVMVDIKGCGDDRVAAYSAEVERALSSHGLLEDALILINKTPKNNQDRIAAHFRGKARVSWRADLTETRRAANGDPDFARHRYVCNHGPDFTRGDIGGFHDLGLEVVVSVNREHYAAGDPLAQGERHLRDVLAWGADGVQIDSCYDGVFEA